MDPSYVKSDNVALFGSLSSDTALDLRDPQNYVPLYSRLYSLTPSNGKHLNLPYHRRLVEVTGKDGGVLYAGTTRDRDGKERKTDVFFKLSPILDPLRYITGRYDISDPHLLGLPGLMDEACHPKARDPNNSAYVDAFFSYLASGILHTHGFVHAVDSYGSFLAIKRGFPIDVAEDLDHLSSSDFFAKHEGDLFAFDEAARSRFAHGLGSGKRRTPLALGEPASIGDDLAEEPETSPACVQLSSIFTAAPAQPEAPGLEIVFESQPAAREGAGRPSLGRRSSECSSRSSATDRDGDSECASRSGESMCTDDAIGSDVVSEAGTSSTLGDEAFILVIKEFPVHCIALERCKETLDELILKQKLSPGEWESAMFQVIVSLMAYGRCFKLTHNDLHTNNIMYVSTDKKHLLYKIGGRHYKVPTYGRIFKIIDFGRAIYEYGGRRMCSDSYHKRGDAATQYNCEPYLNPKRPRLDPNPSFDLCRLGCALYDFLMDEYDDPEYRLPAVVEMIVGWCNDDKGRNVMYKSSGVERYPDFKLYKMIARTVHKHIPSKALETPCLQRYLVPRSALGRKARILNLDSLPCYA